MKTTNVASEGTFRPSMRQRVLGRNPHGEGVTGLLFFAPALILVFGFKGLPLVRGILTSLTVKGHFVGLANYERMLKDHLWLESLGNAARGFVVLPIFIVVPLFLAAVLFQRVRGWKFFRATFFLGYVLPAAMAGIMFGIILGSNGPLLSFLRAVGLGGLAVPLLARTETSLWAVYSVVFWAWFGFGTLVYLGGLAAIPEDLYDAAKADGAGFLQTLMHITVPAVLPTMAYWTVVCTSGFLLGLFPFLHTLTAGGPGYSSLLPEYYLYRAFTQPVDPGYSSALGLSLFVFVLLITLLEIRLLYGRAE